MLDQTLQLIGKYVVTRLVCAHSLQGKRDYQISCPINLKHPGKMVIIIAVH